MSVIVLASGCVRRGAGHAGACGPADRIGRGERRPARSAPATLERTTRAAAVEAGALA
jgi:hypothetical protein